MFLSTILLWFNGIWSSQELCVISRLYDVSFSIYERKTKFRWNILHSSETILEKSPWNTGHTFAKFLAFIFHDHKITFIVFRNQKGICNHDLTSPFPPKSMLVHIGELLKALAFLNIAWGKGGDNFHLLTRMRSKTFFEDCLWRM